jgi:DNA-binding LacI/PurR family transcriptional regulator
MKDIAKDLGVSIVTVSGALRNDPDISPVTRALILKRAEELKYSPNSAARALVTGRIGSDGTGCSRSAAYFLCGAGQGLHCHRVGLEPQQ